MKFLLDTSAYSAFNRGDAKLKQYFNALDEILVPLIVIGELRAGFAAGTKCQQNEVLLRQFLDAPSVSSVSITDKSTQLFADVYLRLRKAGTPIGTNDIWIAALCLEHSLPLLTLDICRAPAQGGNPYIVGADWSASFSEPKVHICK